MKNKKFKTILLAMLIPTLFLFCGMIAGCSLFGENKSKMARANSEVQYVSTPALGANTSGAVYLDPTNGNNSNTGADTSNAVKTLEEAVSKAGANGFIVVMNTIEIMQSGTYDFGGITFERYYVDSSTYFTGNLFVLGDEDDATIDITFNNVTINGSTYDIWLGPVNSLIYSPNANLTINNSTLRNNRLRGNNPRGAGINCECNLYLYNTTFDRLSASYGNDVSPAIFRYGSGFYSSGSETLIESCMFGICYGYLGGFFYTTSQTVRINNSIFNNSSADSSHKGDYGYYDGCTEVLITNSTYYISNVVGSSNVDSFLKCENVTSFSIENCEIIRTSERADSCCAPFIWSSGARCVDCVMKKCSFTSTNSKAVPTAIICSGNNLTVEDCVFENSISQGRFLSFGYYGGAISFVGSGALNVSNCTFTNCSSANGGAIYSTSASSLAIDNCSFNSCSATTTTEGQTANGGAIYSTSAGDVAVNNCEFYSCSSTSNGGAVYAENYSSLTISGCNFGDYTDANNNNIFDSGEQVIKACTGSNIVYISTTGPTNIEGCNFYGLQEMFRENNSGNTNNNLIFNNCNFFSSLGAQTYSSDIITNTSVTINNCKFISTKDRPKLVLGLGGVSNYAIFNNCEISNYMSTYVIICNGSNGTIKLNNCNIHDCHSNNYGFVTGFIYFVVENTCFNNITGTNGNLFYSDSVTLTNSTITDCSFRKSFIKENGSVSATNCVFDNLTSSVNIFNNAILNSCTVTNISATSFVLGTTAKITNSTFANNTCSNSVINVGSLSTQEVSSKTYYKLVTTAGALTIDNCVFEGNTSSAMGGAVISSSKTTTITNSTFANNSSANLGGAIVYQGASNGAETPITGVLTLTNCNFLSNTQTTNADINICPISTTVEADITSNSYAISGGGALAILGGQANIVGCNFGGYTDANNNNTWDSGETSLGNSATSNGGAINYTKISILTVQGTNFVCNTTNSGNAMGGAGGAIAKTNVGSANQGTDEFTNCNFTYNTASSFGGAFNDRCQETSEKINFNSCNFTYNACFTSFYDCGGGAVFLSSYGPAHYFTNCNFTNNYSSGSGGAITNAGYTYLTNCIFQNNVANEYGAMRVYVFYLNSDVTILNNVSINSNSSTVRATHYLSPYINGGNIIIKNNYTGANLVEDSSVLANPTNSSQKARIVKSEAFNSLTGELTSTFASDTSILQGNLQIFSYNTNGFTINNAASSQNEIWLSSEMTTPTKTIAKYNKNYKLDISKILSNFHYDNNPGNIVFYIQDDKIYAKVLDTTSTSQIEYTASDFFGLYDSAPHGIDVKVYNTENYTITYSETESGTYTTEPITLIDAGTKTVYFKISAPGLPEVSGNRAITIVKKAVTINLNNASLTGLEFNTSITGAGTGNTINANATVINEYLRGVVAVDSNGQAVSGKFYLTSNYTPNANSYALSGNIRFVPDNLNYAGASLAINATNVLTPVFEFSELYYKSGNFYPTKADADNSTNASGNTTLSNMLQFLKPTGTVYFLEAYTVSSNETINLGSNSYTFSGYAANANNYETKTLIQVNSGRTLSITATDVGAKLTIKGVRDVVTNANICSSLIVNSGTLTLNGNIEITQNNISSNGTSKNGAGIYSTGTLNLTSVNFNNLTANIGGAIYATGATTLTNCNFSLNTVLNSGSKASAIYATGALTLTNCNFASSNDLYISGTNTTDFNSCYTLGTVYVESTTTGTLNLNGANYISTLSYYFYNGSTYSFKLVDNGMSLSSFVYLNPLNATKEEDLIAVYSKYPSGAQNPFSLKTAITGLTLGRTTSGYLGLVSTQTSSSGSGGSTTPTTPTAPTKTSYTLTDLVVATTLSNTGFNPDGTAIDTTTNNLTTTDLVWLPNYEGVDIDSSNVSTAGDPTGINTMIYNLTGVKSSGANRIATPTDFMVANLVGISYYNYSKYNTTQGASTYWLRSPYSAGEAQYIHAIGLKYTLYPAYAGIAARPAMKLNLNAVISAQSQLGIVIGLDTSMGENVHTITIPNIMYPQTKVPAGSTLEQELDSAGGITARTSSTVTPSETLIKTGVTYPGYDGNWQEYKYKNNYYVYAKVNKNNATNNKFSDEFANGATVLDNTNYVWFKVEPIVWYITNWNSLPKSFTGETTEIATPDQQLVLLSQYAIVNVGSYYPNTSDDYRTMWQNSRFRAYLNGYNLAEQNNGTNGNASYASASQASFKGTGFIDTIWHDILALVSYFDPTSGADTNNGLTETTPVATIGGLNSVLTNNPVLNTIAFKSTLTIDEAFITNNPSLVSGDTLTLDFGGRYLTSFDDGTNSFTGNFFNVTATNKKVVITNFKVNGNLTKSDINSKTGLRVQTGATTDVTLSNLDISNCTTRGLTVTGAVTLIDSNIYENVIGVAGKNNGSVVPGSVNGMGASFDSNNVDGTTTILNCNFYGNVGGKDGTAIYVQGKATNQFVMENCKIFNNNHSYNYISGTVYTRIPATFTNCTFYNNRIGTAAGICSTTEVTVNNCVFDSNYSWIYEGGAIKCTSLTATNCQFINNRSERNGGGAIYTTGETNLTDCYFFGNATGASGGAIYSTGATTLTNCTFHDNTSTGEGGAIYSGGEVRINNSKLYNNSSFHNGNGWTGGGAILGGNVVLNNCELFNNSANSAYGGAIKCQYLTATNSKFYNNTAWQGGAMKIDRELTITNCEIYDNYSSSHAGAIYGSVAHCNYSRFYNNHSGGDGVVIRGDKIDVLGCQFYGNSYNPGVMHAYGVISGYKSVVNITDSVFYNNKHSTGTVRGENITLTNCNIFNNESNGFSGGGVHATGWVSATNCNIYNNTTVTHGGGIYAEGAVTVINSNIYNNLAKKNSDKHGGGIYSGGAVTLTNSNVYNNQASGNGGGLYATGGTTLTNCNLYNNTSTGTDGGGAIYTTGTLNLSDCNLYNNTASGNGGGIYSSGSLTASGCNVFNNTSSLMGGGIYTNNAITLTNCDVYNNSATRSGAGVYSASANIKNSNIYNNFSKENGGGLYCGTTAELTGCNVYNNTAAGEGGGLRAGGTATLTNCNIYNNSANGHGGGVYCAHGTFKRCNIYNNEAKDSGGGSYTDRTTDIINCNIFENTAKNQGGGLYSYTALTMNNSNIYGNASSGQGAGFWTLSNAYISNCLVYNNSSLSSDALFIWNYGNSKIKDTVISGNSGNILINNGLSLISLTNCKISNNTCTGLFNKGATLTNCTISGNFSFSSTNGSLINLTTGQTIDLVNCELFSNVVGSSGANSTGNNFIVNNGGELNLNGCRFANNLIAEGSDYKFGGIYTSSGETTLTNCNFSYNLKDNKGASHSASTNGFVGSTDSGQTTNIYNTIFTNNNLGNAGAVVLYGDATLIDVLFESNTGKLGRVTNTDIFNLIISSNNFEGQNGLELNGNFNLYNAIVEGNTNGSSLVVGENGTGLIEKLVADGNEAMHSTGNKGAVLQNSGLLTISNGNSLFNNFAEYIFDNNITVNEFTTLTNNSSHFGGAIYNQGTLNLKDVLLGSSSNGNTAYYGGAIYNNLQGTLTINGAIITYNQAENQTGNNALTGNGGAIYNLGTVALNGGKLSYNQATNGGAIYNLGLFTVNGGEVSYNKASNYGAGICNTEESLDTTGNGTLDTTFKGNLVVNNGQISYNSLTGETSYGSGIYNSGLLTVNGGKFNYNTHENNTTTYGGAIYASGRENYVYGGSFTGNNATKGGAFYAGTSSTLNVSNVYVVLDNTSSTVWVNGGCCAMGEGEENNPVVVNFSNSHITKKYNTGHNRISYVFYIPNEEYDSLNLTSVVVDSISYVGIICVNENSNKNKTSEINIIGCKFSNCNNTVNDGGSVLYARGYYDATKFMIKDSCFYKNNLACLIDTGVYLSTTTITNCTFENNRGNILRLSTATVDNCTFINNVGSYIIGLTNNATRCFASISNITATGNCVNSVIDIKNMAYCNLLGTNIITNNYLSSTRGAVNISNISQYNSKPPLTFGFGGKLIVTDNNLLIEGTSSDYDVEINGIYYKNSNTESNLNIPSGLTILQNGLLSGSKIGLTIYSTEENFELSSLVGKALFSGSNITTKDFSAFYMDNDLGSLMLKDNKVYLASVGNPTTEDNSYTVLVSDLVFVVDGIYHELAQQDFVVFNEYGNKLNTSEYSVYYSLQEDGEYSSISPKFMGVGNNEVFYKVYAGLDNTSTQIGQGSTNLNIVLKSMNLISAPTAYVAKGENLASASFKGGRVIDNLGNTVSGTWAFDAPTTTPTNTTTTYALTFTPTSKDIYSGTVSTSVSVSQKFNYLVYKEVSNVKGFYTQAGVYTGFSKLEDVVSFVSPNATIEILKTYTFETSETITPQGNINLVCTVSETVFKVGSGVAITVEFAGNGYVYFNNKTIANESYLFDVSTASTLVLSNCLISNFIKTYASSSGISSLILNYGTLNLNGTNLISNSVVVSNKTNILGGLIYNTGVVNFNSGNIANNTLTNYTTNGNAYGTVVYNNGGKVNFNGTNFAVNSATGKSSGYGGIVYNANDGSVYVNSGVFSANSAGYGGVVANSDGSVVISGGTMQYNKATNSGAVLFTDTAKQNNLIYYNGAVVTLETLSQLNNFNNAINATPVVYSNLLVLQVVIVVVSFALICLTFARVYVYKLKKK